MPSVVGLLEQRELAARRRLDELREETDRLGSDATTAYNCGNRAFWEPVWDRTPEPPRNPAFLRRPPRGHPIRTPVRPGRHIDR